MRALLPLMMLVAGCAATLESDAPERVVSTTTESVIESGGYQGSLWLSQDFEGAQTRTMEGNSLTVEMAQTAERGGLDAGVGLYTGPPKPRFGELHPDSRACFDYDVALSGEGRWWAGPKISVNWQDSDNPDGTSGWYENYVIETASTSPEEIAKGLLDWGQGVFIGETVHDGGTYRHYRAKHQDWVQYWAIRQGYRNSGSTSLGPIWAKWREDGLPEDLPFDGVKLNIETYGPVKGEFTVVGDVAHDYLTAPGDLCRTF